MSSRKKILLLVIGTAVLLSGVLFLASIDRTTAQETFIPIELPWDTPPPHRLYYIAEPAAVERKSLLSPERMAQVLGTTFVSAGEIEGRVSSVSEIDGVIIHHSAISTVDPEWLGGLYQSGVVVAFINTWAPEVARLTGDACIGAGGWMDGSDPYPGDFYIAVSRLVINEQGEVVRLAGQLPCNRRPASRDIEGERIAEIYGGGSQYMLDDENDLNRCAIKIAYEVDAIYEIKQEYQK
jgi:hypothetical protein